MTRQEQRRRAVSKAARVAPGGSNTTFALAAFCLTLVSCLSTTSVLVSAAANYSVGLHDHTTECTLYMAPSSISGAGLGLYAARELPKGSLIDSYGMYLPVVDYMKVLPYKGQHRFLSWLGYVWPKQNNAFYPSYDDDTEPLLPRAGFGVDEGLNGAADAIKFFDTSRQRISAFAPGLASLVNSHRGMANVMANVQHHKQWSTRTPTAKDPYYGLNFVASTTIYAGAELFLDYGEEYHDRLVHRQESTGEFFPYTPQHEGFEGFHDLPTEEEKRNLDRRDTEEIEALMASAKLLSNKSRSTGSPVPFRHLFKPETADEDQEDDDDEDNDEVPEEELEDEEHYVEYHPVEYDEVARSVKQLAWLEKYGVCVDSQIRWGISEIPNAGRGAFAKQAIPTGTVLAATPLLTLKRDDLEIHKTSQADDQYRAHLTDEIIGHEVLLNYAFGHPDSHVLVVPYAPVVSFINHDGQRPNAKIQWSDSSAAKRMLNRYPKEWLDLHPLDVIDQSGRLMAEFVALRDLLPGEEILIDYGQDWQDAWDKHVQEDSKTEFRHEIRVPDGFFPDNWLHQSITYTVQNFEPLQPGQLVQLKWAHNGKPVADYAYAVGLPKGYSEHFRQYIKRVGIYDRYQKLLLAETSILKDNEFYTFESQGEGEWFGHAFENNRWKFNMIYVAAWNETARTSLLRNMGQAGWSVALEAVGNHFKLDNLTCFHASFMGATECENSRRHSDVYETGGKGFNMIWPLFLKEGSNPELDIIATDLNIEISVKYKDDIAYVMSDYGYHKTSTNSYSDSGEIRVVAGTYCAQMDHANMDQLKWIYNGEIYAPFLDMFDKFPFPETHWTKDGTGEFQQMYKHPIDPDAGNCSPETTTPETKESSLNTAAGVSLSSVVTGV